MKLHKKCRFRFLRQVSGPNRKRIRWALSLKPGDMINDCSGFNVVIREIDPCVAFFNKGWFICDVDFTVEPFGGGCSLAHCGVEPPLPPEEIERRIRQFYDEWEDNGGGWDWKTEKDSVWMRLSQGLPICDEQGMKIRDDDDGR